MPGLATELQSAPSWMQEYTQELLNRSRQLAAERYQPYGQVSPERNQVIKSEIERLVGRSKEKGKFDIIPFSITGKSEPINLSPHDLRKIIENEGFARRIYESTTGYHNVSRGELDDLRQRADKKLQIEASSNDEVRRILSQTPPPPTSPEGDIDAVRTALKKFQESEEPVFKELSRLDREKGKITEQLSRLETNRKSIAKQLSEVPQLVGMLNQGLNTSKRKPYEDQLSQLDVEKGKLTEQLTKVEKEINPFQEHLAKLQREKKPLTEQLSRLESQAPEDVVRRASIERELKNLQKQRGTIAPMNEIHERAISMLERGLDDDTMKLAADELRKAGRHSELEAVQPLVHASLEGPSDEYMNKYVNDYTRDIRKALEDESEEQFIEHIAPKINMSFAQMGAFHSGARAKALMDSLSKHRLKLHRELAHLTAGARDKAMEHHELQKRRQQSAAHIMEQATKSEREGARHQAELVRQQAVTKHGLAQLDAAALGQVARARQEQEQHEIDAERQELARQQLHPQEQLAREAALLSGLPPPASQSIGGALQPAPQPPNLLTLGAGALGALASGFSKQQNPIPYKKGGSVRKNYANGGPVGQDEIGNEIRKVIEEQRQGDKAHLEQASQYNPVQSWLHHVGNEMLANPHEDPLLSLGRGTTASFNHRDLTRERAANLYDKIQATRLNQYQVLAAYENMKAKNALGRESLAEQRRHHQQQHDLAQQHLGLQRENVSLRNHQLNQSKSVKPISATERKLEHDAKKDLMRAIRMKKEVNHLGELVKKTSTGPIIGGIKSILPKTKVDNQIEVGTNKLILDMHQGMKNIPRSEEFLKRIESTKPNRSNYPEANEEALVLMNQGANDVEEHSISTLLSLGWTPEKIEKQFKIKVPDHFLGESSEEGGSQESDIIQMLDPDGEPLEVPVQDVEEALRRGARLA